MKLEFYNWETKQYEDLGVLPLAKSNENKDLKVVEGFDFFDLEAEYNGSDLARESGVRLKMMTVDIIKLFIKTGRNNPQVIDFDGLNNQKVKFAIEGRLRKLGSNSEYRQPIYDRGILVGTYKVNYQINEKGNETFTESYDQ